MTPNSEQPVQFGTARDDYFDAIMSGDRHGALAVVASLLERGVTAEEALSDVVAGAMGMVGDAWQECRASVSREHRASGITEYVIHAAVDEAMLAPGAIEEGCAGAAVVACAEGEWHVLPGHIATAVLRLRGFEASFVGPSVPADDLAGFLDKGAPPAVIVSCVMQISLIGAWRTISALRATGTRVIAGGRGFGPDGTWATAIGADAFAPDFLTAAELLAAELARPASPPRDPAGDPSATAEAESVHAHADTVVAAATQTALRRWPALRESPLARATREDLAATLQALTSALVVGSDDVLADFVGWFEDVLVARNLPVGYVPTALALLAECLADSFPRIRDLAIRGLDLCRVPPMTASDPVL